MTLNHVMESLKGQAFNTKNINLAFVNARFDTDLKPTNVLARKFTAHIMRIIEVGKMLEEIPNISKSQEVAETNITQYRAIQTKESIDMFNVFVDLIQPPSMKAAQVREGLENTAKNFKSYINGYVSLMGSLIKKSAEDGKSAAYVAQLKEAEKPLKAIVSEIKLLNNDAVKLNEEFVSLANKAYLGLPHEAKGKAAQPAAPSNTQSPGNN